MNRAVRLGVAVLLTVGVAGCDASAGDDEVSSTDRPARPAPTSTAVPDVDRPCADIDDATLRSLGFSPASRRTLRTQLPETSACSFSSSDIDLTVAAANTTFQEYRDRTKGMSEGLNVGSRPARMVRRPGKGGVCELAMKSDDGVVLLRTMISVSAREWGMDQCGQMKRIAGVIESAIGSS